MTLLTLLNVSIKYEVQTLTKLWDVTLSIKIKKAVCSS